MTDWFTSDPHFWHGNMIHKHKTRQFENVFEMNKTLIERFNECVKPEDSAYILGDVSFGSPGRTHEILKQLNGKKYLILGNHDKMFRKKEELQLYFEWVKEAAYVEIHDRETNKHQGIYLHHYACKVWPKRHYGSWNLYGHSHGSLPDDPDSLQMDVGVDCNDYRPFSFEEIKEVMKKKKNKPVDHHKNRR